MIMGNLGDLTGLVAVMSPFVSCILIVFFVLRNDFRKRKEKYEVVKKAIDNNYTLPDGFFCEDKGVKSSLESSMMLMGVGLGLLIPCFLSWMPEPLRVVMVAVSCILLLMGVGRFLAWNIDQKIKKEEENRRRNTEE